MTTEVTIPVAVIALIAFVCTVVGGAIGAWSVKRAFDAAIKKPWQRMGL